MVTIDAHARRPRTRRRTSSRAWRRAIAFYLFIGPWLIGFVLLGVIPLTLGFLTSLTNYDGLNLASIKFVGLRNYTRAFADPDAIFSFWRTLVWSALNTPIWLLLSFALALVLNQRVKGQGFFRTLYYLPSVIPLVATIWIWKIFLEANNGLLNAIISLFRPGTAIPWLSGYALPSLTAIAVWAGLGSGMVIFLAGLQGIPSELEEAARIDGASAWQILRYVTIPLMTPVIFFQLVLALISALQTFVAPLLLSNVSASEVSIPPREIYLYMIHTYRQIFVYQRFGYGAALLWLLFIVILALTLLVFRTARYWVHYEVEIEGAER
jgi:multiple sugar transport system permease protein